VRAEEIAQAHKKRKRLQVGGLLLLSLLGFAVALSVAKSRYEKTENGTPQPVSKSDFRKLSIKHKKLSETVVNLESQFKELNIKIDRLEGEIESMNQGSSVTESGIEIPLADPVPKKLNGIVRDHSRKLVDQLNNPGALVYGPRAQRFGAENHYPARGHNYAQFDDRQHGLAALVDLIMAWDGSTIRDYVSDGKTSYSGGNEDLARYYIQVFSDQGIQPDVVIDRKDTGLIQSIADVHTHAEGSDFINSPAEYNEAFAIQEISKK